LQHGSRGIHHYNDITRLSASKDEQDILEQASLTCKMVVSYWDTIHELLQPAQRAVEAVQGTFENMLAGLENIRENVDSLSELLTDNVLASDAGPWKALEEHASSMLKSGFNSYDEPPEGL